MELRVGQEVGRGPIYIWTAGTEDCPGKCIVYGQLAKPPGIFMGSGVRVLQRFIRPRIFHKLRGNLRVIAPLPSASDAA